MARSDETRRMLETITERRCLTFGSRISAEENRG